MVSHDDNRPPAVDQGLYGLTREEQNALQPSVALDSLLHQAQDDHRKCVTEALAANENVTEACALTWGNVWVRYRQWAEYRPPFKTEYALKRWAKTWSKKILKDETQAAESS
eukprot:CAMPEP_0201521906 /NCGR_PEP_ID=MMETSP0161_2-20130828/16346_1 /ASSEMBLY_ACC=CAM_ASM_000251 /TAXON_ID=180227 /ORGANISM="Neoparamoeba aestuarina, Strain SoJaBio B1-5/56/2" /LENGTH=111 /DNA_ID=CAMNT_0047920643 /DNA_START=24 /DNA_END=359 /DNA_ORIENTATION=-